MESLALFVSVPIAAFRAPFAREYLETLPCPPPATVYGMCLSLVGETNRRVHIGTEIALALLSDPVRSTVLRTSWRFKTSDPPGIGSNKRPDYQELLSDVRLAIWMRDGADTVAPRSLRERLRAVIDREESPDRFGGLALGESTHLVDEIRRLRSDDGATCRLLMANSVGDLALPIWVDHVGSRGTRWGQYRLDEQVVPDDIPATAWTRIAPPEVTNER